MQNVFDTINFNVHFKNKTFLQTYPVKIAECFRCACFAMPIKTTRGEPPISQWNFKKIRFGKLHVQSKQNPPKTISMAEKPPLWPPMAAAALHNTALLSWPQPRRCPPQPFPQFPLAASPLCVTHTHTIANNNVCADFTPWRFLPNVSYFDVYFASQLSKAPPNVTVMRILMCNNELNCHQQGWSRWWLVRQALVKCGMVLLHRQSFLSCHRLQQQ